jgi:hypothetical protein
LGARPRLRALRLARCGLEGRLPQGFGEELEALEELDLSGNALEPGDALPPWLVVDRWAGPGRGGRARRRAYGLPGARQLPRSRRRRAASRCIAGRAVSWPAQDCRARGPPAPLRRRRSAPPRVVKGAAGGGRLLCAPLAFVKPGGEEGGAALLDPSYYGFQVAGAAGLLGGEPAPPSRDARARGRAAAARRAIFRKR